MLSLATWTQRSVLSVSQHMLGCSWHEEVSSFRLHNLRYIHIWSKLPYRLFTVFALPFNPPLPTQYYPEKIWS